MAGIATAEKSIVFDNAFVTLTVANAGAAVKSIIDKKTGRDIKGEDTAFFALVTADKKTEFKTLDARLEGDRVKVTTQGGDFEVKVTAFDGYFEFELLSELPRDCYKARIAHAKFDYDPTDRSSVGACGVALTYWVNPVFYPDSKDCQTMGELTRHLRHKNGRYALMIAPICEQCELIKTAFRTVDRNNGIYSEIGGAWGRDSRINFGNYTIQVESAKEFIDDNLEFFTTIGVDQIDFHQGPGAFRQGDFAVGRYENTAEFKKNVTDRLEAVGIAAGMQPYAFYINYESPILADPAWQDQIGVLESFTLACDVDADADFFPTVESTAEVSTNYEFFSRNTPLILVGNEIVRFINAPDGFKVARRGVASSKAAVHKKGEKIHHLDGFFGEVAPVPGSPLFLEVARRMARLFNEGGFTQIYLDALDGISAHCDGPNEAWYYTAQFICELLKYTDKFPLLEYSIMFPSIWSGRGRVGAYDTPYRSYKAFNTKHLEANKAFIDRYSAPTMGWYNFYPLTEEYPGNEHTKYHHADQVEHLGSIALMYDFSNVYNNIKKKDLERYSAMRRNLDIYRRYDELRKAEYFDKEYLDKLKAGKYEYHLKQKRGGRWTFVEKDYKSAKLYDLGDSRRNSAELFNPFSSQTPFIRIEALMSSDGSEPLVLLPLDENKELLSQFKFGEDSIAWNFGGELDLSDKLAKKVRVFGNGKKGGAVCIKTRCGSNSEHGYGEYIIDTDFDGWREFILLEADNGERPDLPFDDKEDFYAVYRSGLNNDRTSRIEVETAGDVSGVRMSSVVACAHTYEVLKNPTVRVGNTSVEFKCELMSSDFIEFDGTAAKVIDRYGNEKKIWFTSDNFKVPRGKYKISLEAKALNRNVPRAVLTVGLTGKEVK